MHLYIVHITLSEGIIGGSAIRSTSDLSGVKRSEGRPLEGVVPLRCFLRRLGAPLKTSEAVADPPMF